MPLRSLIVICVVISLAIFFLKNQLLEWGVDIIALWVGNLLLFFITVLVSWFHKKGAMDKNPHAFVRSVYAGTMIKMFVVMIAVLVYALAVKPVNKPAIVGFLLFYVLYTFVEVKGAMKTVKASGK